MQARLLIESGVASPRSLDLDDSSVVLLGRNRENHIYLQDRRASRAHARVFARDGKFFIGHQGEPPTNPTAISGRRIEGDTPLRDGQLISIGDVRIRFVAMSDEPSDVPHLVSAPALDASDTTLFQVDEFTALFRFVNDSLAQVKPLNLIRQALEVVRRQTGADVVGFLGLEAETPELRLVLPEEADFDRRLSTQLTQRVQSEGRSVWLAGPNSPQSSNDSLSDVSDAICVALRTASGELPLGALHVYKKTGVFAERQFRFCEVLGRSLASSLHLLRSRRALEADNRRLRETTSSCDLMVGESTAFVRLEQKIEKLADGPDTILVHGESGVGKELVAVLLHRNSTRVDGPLVTVNCAAINEKLAESELFGHVKGAFTDASRDHDGYFAQADMGTLFLDEIGELSQDLQSKLLRAIEYHTFRPVGSREEAKADVRVIAATNRDLEAEVRAGRFRRDLFFRLNARIMVPPLRDRREDIPVLAAHFLNLFAVKYHRRVGLSVSALERLTAFSWPGNVRQLRSVLDSAVALAHDGDTIHAGDLNLIGDPLIEQPGDCPPSLNLEALEQWAIRKALVQTGGNQTRAATILGMHRGTLIQKAQKYGIDRNNLGA